MYSRTVSNEKNQCFMKELKIIFEDYNCKDLIICRITFPYQ